MGERFTMSTSSSHRRVTRTVRSVGLRRTQLLSMALVLVCGFAGEVRSSEIKLTAPDGAANDGFGAAVGMGAFVVAVGAPGVDVAGNMDAGAAYVFLLDQFAQRFSGDQSGGNLGTSVAVAATNGRIVVGEPGANSQRGRVRIYTPSLFLTYVPEATLEAPDGVAADLFGKSVALSEAGDVLVVGAPHHNAPSTDQPLGYNALAGAAYVFRRSGSTWTFEQKVYLDDSYSPFYARFGSAVSVSGDVLAIGAPHWGQQTYNWDEGLILVYGYTASGWAPQLSRFGDWYPGAADELGSALSLSGNVLAAGSPEHQTGLGRVNVIYLDGSRPDEELRECCLTGRYGAAVAVPDGVRLVVGAPAGYQGSLPAPGAGFLYEFGASAWSGSSLSPSDPQSDQVFGSSVAASTYQSTDFVVVGAPGDTHSGLTGAGAAYLYVEDTTTTTSTTSTTTSSTPTTTLPCAPAPVSGCQPAYPQRSVLGIADNTPDTNDKVTWKWRSSGTVTANDLGDPLSGTSYTLCLYDGSGLRLEMTAPAGGLCAEAPCWKNSSGKLTYTNKDLTAEGLLKMRLAPGDAGKGKIAVKGKGVNLAMPPLPLAFPVRAQVVRTESTACWEASYSTALVNDGVKVKAKSDLP